MYVCTFWNHVLWFYQRASTLRWHSTWTRRIGIWPRAWWCSERPSTDCTATSSKNFEWKSLSARVRDTIKLVLNAVRKVVLTLGKIVDTPVEDSAEKAIAPLSQESPVKVTDYSMWLLRIMECIKHPILKDCCAFFWWSGSHLTRYIHALWRLELWVTAAYGLADRAWNPDLIQFNITRS